LETVVRTFVPSNIVILSLICEGLDRGLPRAADMSKELDWLGLLRLGPCGQWTKEQHILIGAGWRGLAAYGPNWTLPAGRYEASLKVKSDANVAGPFLIAEILSDRQYRAVGFFDGTRGEQGEYKLQFDVHEDEAPTGELAVELRLRAAGAAGII